MGVSIGIVGAGSFAQSFIGLVKAHPLVDRVALADINADNLSRSAQTFGVGETYDSLEAICRTDVQALMIMTQPWLHAPQVIAAMRSGKHAYSAVPIISLDDGGEMLAWCDRLIEACRRTGMHYMMGETSYYRPEAMYGRRQARAGAFGQFVHAEGRYLHDVDSPASNLRDVSRRRHGPAWTPRLSGGPPMHYPTHSLGGLISVMGAHATEVSARGHVIPGDDWHRADTVSGNLFGNETALFRMSNGATALICEHRKIGHVNFEGMTLYGTEASLVARPREADGVEWVTRHGVRALTPEAMRDALPDDVVQAFSRAHPKNPYGGHGGSHAYLVHEFVSALAESRRPAIHAWEAVRYFAPGVVAHKSALRDGELLKVPDWGDAPA